MYLPPSMKNYDPVKRKQEWEQRLKDAMEKTVKDILQNTEQKDSTFLLLENLDFKLQDVKSEIENNNSPHRDQNFVRFSATVTDLLIELDKIDTAYASKHHKDMRTDLLDQLRKAANSINANATCTSDSCKICSSKNTKILGL